jgi:hypothetical protein
MDASTTAGDDQLCAKIAKPPGDGEPNSTLAARPTDQRDVAPQIIEHYLPLQTY